MKRLFTVNVLFSRLTRLWTIGQAVRDAYNAPGNMANRRFIGTTGPLGKTNQLGLLETPNEFIKPPRAKNYKNWQADHVLDLGFWTTIAKKDTPAGIQDDTWVTVQDAILGEKEVCPVSNETPNAKLIKRQGLGHSAST